MQEAAEDGLEGIRGSAVALDPRTGAILAMVSDPTFDPNDLAGHDLDQLGKNYAALNADPAKPLVNRSINGDLYPPGSVFKVVTAAAALSTGEYTEDTRVPGPAVLDLPDTTADLPNHDGRACGPQEEVTLTEALAVSCNTAFARVGMDIGDEALQSQAAKFGFGELGRGAHARHPQHGARRDEPAPARAGEHRAVRRAGHPDADGHGGGGCRQRGRGDEALPRAVGDRVRPRRSSTPPTRRSSRRP